MGAITVLDPTSRPNSRNFSVASRVRDLNNRVLGILWNGKPNGDILLSRIREALSCKFKLSATRLWKKSAVDLPAGDLLKEIALDADIIINGNGD